MADSSQPLVSVILPVYNGAALVMKAIQSVLGQRYPHLELLVINDGSTDNTLEVLSQITDPRVILLNQPNGGTAVARNHGLSVARGQWIAMIDSDDLWLDTKLETEIALAQKVGQPCLVFSGYYGVDNQDQMLNKSPLFSESGDMFEIVLTRESVMLPSTTVVHKTVFDTVGGFDPGHFHEDREFFIRACQKFSAYPTGQHLVLYRQSTEGKCRSLLADYTRAVKEELSIVDTLRPILSEKEVKKLYEVQTRHLFYRFLMYDYMRSASELYPMVDTNALWDRVKQGDKKALLSVFSFYTRLNVLSGARKVVQWGYRTLGRQRWQQQLNTWGIPS